MEKQEPHTGGLKPGQLVLMPDPACKGGWQLVMVLALQADDSVLVQHTAGEGVSTVPAAGLKALNVQAASTLQQGEQPDDAQQQQQQQQRRQQQQEAHQEQQQQQQQQQQQATPQSPLRQPPDEPRGGTKAGSCKRSAAAMDAPAADAMPAADRQGEVVSGIYTHTKAQANAIRAWEQQWQQAKQPGQRCIPLSKTPDPRLPTHCIQFHVKRIPGVTGVNKPTDTYFMAPDGTQRNTLGKLLVQMGLAEKEPAKRPARATASAAGRGSDCGADPVSQQQPVPGSSRNGFAERRQQQDSMQQQDGENISMQPMGTGPDPSFEAASSKQRHHWEQEARERDQWPGVGDQATSKGQQHGFGAADSSEQCHGDNQHTQEEGEVHTAVDAGSLHGVGGKQQQRHSDAEGKEDTKGGPEKQAASQDGGWEPKAGVGCGPEGRPPQHQQEQQGQEQQQQQQAHSTPGTVQVKDMVNLVLRLCVQVADPDIISASLGMVSTLKDSEAAPGRFSSTCYIQLQQLAASDQPHPRLVRWALQWAAARLEGGSSAGSSSEAAAAALAVMKEQSVSAQQVAFSEKEVQGFAEELLDMAAGRPQLGGHLQRLLQHLADSDDTVATYGHSHRMLLLDAVAKGGGLLETVLEFMLGSL